jgi:hypothetical protein
MKIEEGKYYRTRDDRKVGPAVRISGDKFQWNIPLEGNFLAYDDDGYICTGRVPWDIIAEWVDDISDILNSIDVTDTDGNGDKHYLSDYPETISAEIGGLYEEPKYPTLWCDMTPEEKGALLLAHHEGKEIELFNERGLCAWMSHIHPEEFWLDEYAYRIKPEPKVEVVVLENDRNGGRSFYEDSGTHKNTHRITFNLIDGEPDCDSIKMEKVQ